MGFPCSEVKALGSGRIIYILGLPTDRDAGSSKGGQWLFVDTTVSDLPKVIYGAREKPPSSGVPVELVVHRKPRERFAFLV